MHFVEKKKGLKIYINCISLLARRMVVIQCQ